MHVLLGLLTAIVSILYLLNRLGINLGGLNPFDWRRRRAYAKKYGADPIYSVENPIDIAALLIIGAAKIDGDLTAHQKQVAQEQFEENFSLDARAASQLFGSAAHLLAAPQLIDTQLRSLADKNKGHLSQDQAESMVQMMIEVASADGNLSPTQSEYIESIRSLLAPEVEKSEGTWAQ